MLAAVLAVGLTVVLPTVPALAAAADCPCNGEIRPVVKGDTFHGSMAQASFTAEVTATEENIRPGVRGLDLAVDEVWEGGVRETVAAEVLMEQDGCVDFSVGNELLLFTVTGTADEGRGTGDETVILPCGGAHEAEEAAVLGPGQPPSPPASDDGVSPWLVGIPIGGIAVVGVAVLLLVRRRAGSGDAT